MPVDLSDFEAVDEQPDLSEFEAVEEPRKVIPPTLSPYDRQRIAFGSTDTGRTGAFSGPEYKADVSEPVRAVGRALGATGRGLSAMAKAYLFEAAGALPLPGTGNASDLQLEALGMKEPPPGESEPDPYKSGMNVLPPSMRVIPSAGMGLIESAPRLAGTAALQAGGMPAPLAAAMMFGATEEGFDPKQAAIAAVLPVVGKYTGAITELAASKAGVANDVAQATLNRIGGASGAAALVGADQWNEIRKLPEDQREGAIVDAVGNVLSLSVLGAMGERHQFRGQTTVLPPEGRGRSRVVGQRQIEGPTIDVGEGYTTGRQPLLASGQRLLGEGEPVVETPTPAAAPEVARLNPESPGGLDKFGNPHGTSYYATPEDWAAWQKVQAMPPSLEKLAAINEIKHRYAGMPPEPPKQATPATPSFRGHSVESVLKMPPEKFFDVASDWKNRTMANEPDALPQQQMAEALADAHPDIDVWKKANESAIAERSKVVQEIKADPDSFEIRQKDLAGAAFKTQFFGEGIKHLETKAKPQSQPSDVTVPTAPVQRTPSAPAKQGRKFFIRPRSDGIRDVLDAVQEEGGMKPPSAVKNKGGEYDNFKSAFQGAGRLLFSKSAGHTADTMAQAISAEFPKIQSGQDLLDAIRAATQERRKISETGGGYAGQADRFWSAVSDPKNKSGLEKVNVHDLKVGDVFRIKGKDISHEDLTVTHIDPDSGDIQVRDGPKLGIQDLPDGLEFYIQRGSLKPSEEVPFEANAEDAFALNAPESIEEQKARLAKEESDRKSKADKDKLAAEAAAPLVGTTGDLGQGDLLDHPTDLFAPKSKTVPIESRGSSGGNLSTLGALDPANWKGAIDAGRDIYSKAKDFASWSIEMVKRLGEGIRSRLETIWDFIKSGFEEARASRDEPLPPENERLNVTIPGLSALGEGVKRAADYIRRVREEEFKAPKMTDLRRSVLNWSAKLQRSFVESEKLQRDIRSKVKSEARREGITNWIQADGDMAVLASRLAATKDAKLKRGYQAALDLTPDEIAVADQVRKTFGDLHTRGTAADVLHSFRDNYVPQVWNIKKGGTPPPGTSSRTLLNKFRFDKARTFESFFQGEQAGFTPKTKDIAKLLPMYSHEMNSVIAAREMVKQMEKGKANDGRPLLSPKGIGVPIDTGSGKSTLVIPKIPKEGTQDYKELPGQPALSKWKWVSKDSAGNPVFVNGELALHPEAYAKLKNVLGRSAIREWYNTPTTALAEIPKGIVRGLDFANSETKRTMLGLLGTFHQVQTGTHAVGHRINPFFSIPEIDLVKNPEQMDASKHGLMLAPDRASKEQFMEGFQHSGLVSKIPLIGPLSDWYSHYLFSSYIPGLKFKTYQAIVARNTKVFAKDLASGKVTPEDVKVLSAQQANAAYGHLNYADIGRNPTVQHVAQLGLLAPDFLEARARFAGQAIKGLSGGKVGREQLLALATLAVAQAVGAYAVSKISGGDWDWKHPFEFTKDNRRYTLRSVPEDLQRLVTDTRMFVNNRISPLLGKGALQYSTGVNYRGERVGAGETTKELLQQPIPLTLRGPVSKLLGTGSSTLTGLEQLAGSLGLKISRYSPAMDVRDMVNDWQKNNEDPKVRADYERAQREVVTSDYSRLRSALGNNDLPRARSEYDELLKVHSPKEVQDAMNPMKARPFTGSKVNEVRFRNTLNEEQTKLYEAAVDERRKNYERFGDMLNKTGDQSTNSPAVNWNDFEPVK